MGVGVRAEDGRERRRRKSVGRGDKGVEYKGRAEGEVRKSKKIGHAGFPRDPSSRY